MSCKRVEKPGMRDEIRNDDKGPDSKHPVWGEADESQRERERWRQEGEMEAGGSLGRN